VPLTHFGMFLENLGTTSFITERLTKWMMNCAWTNLRFFFAKNGGDKDLESKS
jgi:hypothetical protein